jgi:hypothetical protein
VIAARTCPDDISWEWESYTATPSQIVFNNMGGVQTEVYERAP